ncbi:MAG TPA: selenide, water dikinase SelD [Chitinispirillaceae bacterium]|jgi:selenide,water dikinase|nr:selenide, water dikinase SelD [Chitinispirillaceae bacterium]
MSFDLLSTVEYGGCSAKISALQLSEALKDIPRIKDRNLLVDIETHDDAGVYRINDDLALIQTTDFFPPVCSDPVNFGRIAAANAMSDVYAMGGSVLTAMNLVMFPSKRIPLSVLKDILKGGQEKVSEAGGVIVGGHTIDDFPPKYGLAVTGTIHPEKIITNAAAQKGDLLILTKPLGTGVIIAGKRVGLVNETHYQAALDSMMLLNKRGAEIMQEFGVRCATDITGFGLLGHALKMADASGVTFLIESQTVPFFEGAYELAEMGCIPGAGFRNQEFIEKNTEFARDLDYNRRMLLLDAQTSGGLFMSVPELYAGNVLKALRESGYPQSEIIGKVVERTSSLLEVF